MKEILILSAKGAAGGLTIALFYIWDSASRLLEAYGEAAQAAVSRVTAWLQPYLPEMAELFRLKALNCTGASCVTTQVIVPVFVVLCSWVLFFGALFVLRRLMGAKGERPLLLNVLVLVILLASPLAVFDVSRDIAALRAQGKALAETAANKL